MMSLKVTRKPSLIYVDMEEWGIYVICVWLSLILVHVLVVHEEAIPSAAWHCP